AQAVIVQLIQSVKVKFPAEFDQVRAQLEEELALVLDACLTLQVNLPPTPS
ncbi:importin-4, partial [Biomphalaria glabrata]